MRLLILNYEFPPLGGGAANATYYLLKEFAKNPDIYINLVTSSIDTYKMEKFADNIRIHYLNIGKKGNLHYQPNKDLLKYSWKAYRYCKNLMATKQYDLCHAFFGIPCGYIAMKLGLPYIVSLRGSDVPFYNKRFYLLDTLFFKRLSRKVWARANRVIANSDGLKELALKVGTKREIEVIMNGIDTQEFSPPSKRADKRNLVLISTGRLIERKGYEYLIAATRNLNGIEIQLIGDGNLSAKLKDLSKESGVQTNFLGKVSHEKIVGHLQNADVFVLPSLNEGMSNSILEAMATGLPIITTNVGGSKELINGNGYVIKPYSSEDIKSAVENYIGDRGLVLKHGKQSRELAEKMSWSNIAKKYRGVYQGCVLVSTPGA